MPPASQGARCLAAGRARGHPGSVQGCVFGSASGAIVNLVALMYYLFAGGRVFAAEELQTLLAETGFEDVSLGGSAPVAWYQPDNGPCAYE